MENSAHRRLRRSRTRARTILRNHTSGLATEPSIIVWATRQLEGHHSRSGLPAKAMNTAGNTGWYCFWCKRTNSHKTSHCGQCGWAWWDLQAQTAYAAESSGAPWREASPRRRATSPRRRADWTDKGGKGAQIIGGGKGKVKGKGDGVKGTPPAPVLQDLPQPPKPVQVAVPKGGGGQSGPPSLATTAGSSDALLQAVLSHVATEELPESIRDAVGQYKSSSIKMNAKHMHSLVSAQQQARRELARLRQERDNYEIAWESYVQKLTNLFARQLKDREETLDVFEQAEKEWLNQLEQATQDLQQKAAAEGQKTEASADTVMQTSDVEDAAVLAELERARRRREQVAEQNAGVLQALESAQAATQGASKRDGSRTPRRASNKRVVDLVSPSKDGEGGASPPP